MLTKNIAPNIIAILIVAGSFFVMEPMHSILLSVGLFALSGAMTNWLAIHMLFERIPGLYGSGVIPLHFVEFKQALHKLATEELFKVENVESALQKATDSDSTLIDVTPALNALDLDVAFDRLVAVIMESSLGGMLGMVGGPAALTPMKEPFKEQIGQFLIETTQSERFQTALHGQISQVTTSDEFIKKVDQIIHARLEELTPEMVKNIIQRMIKEHLGWLVVWGGVFGGLIGLVTALVF